MLARDGRSDRLYICAGGFNRDSRFEPADAECEMMSAVIFIERGRDRLPDFSLDGKAESRGHYPDDRHAPAVNSDCAADDTRIAAKAPTPDRKSVGEGRRGRLCGR